MYDFFAYKPHNLLSPTQKNLVEELFENNITPLLDKLTQKEEWIPTAYSVLVPILFTPDRERIKSLSEHYYGPNNAKALQAIHLLIHGATCDNDKWMSYLLEGRIGAIVAKKEETKNEIGLHFHRAIYDWMYKKDATTLYIQMKEQGLDLNTTPMSHLSM